MITLNFQPDTPIETIIFDCDGTLSKIEGIDVLAEHNGVGTEVRKLTQDAMGRTGMNPELYRKRLELVNPTEEQVFMLGTEYYANRTEDAEHIIQILNRLHKSIYILSAGLYPAIKVFGKLLDINADHIIAVDVSFDNRGRYMGYNQHSPLGYTNGKRAIISELKKNHPTIAMIGDGLNDFETKDLVERFIGFGGNYYRENIALHCTYYIRCLSLAPVLPLVLTTTECQQLLPAEKILYDKGVKLLSSE